MMFGMELGWILREEGAGRGKYLLGGVERKDGASLDARPPGGFSSDGREGEGKEVETGWVCDLSLMMVDAEALQFYGPCESIP